MLTVPPTVPINNRIIDLLYFYQAHFPTAPCDVFEIVDYAPLKSRRNVYSQ
jgi:hypothetical protein